MDQRGEGRTTGPATGITRFVRLKLSCGRTYLGTRAVFLMMTLDELLLELTSGDDERAEGAVRSLSGYGEAALDALRSMLASPDVDRRWWAVRALAEIPGGAAIPFIIQALSDEDPAVRQCAALGLCQQPDIPDDSVAEVVVPALIEAMASNDALLARLAANALTCIGAAAVPALLDLLANSPDPVRLEAARALALIGDTRAIPALFEALEDDSALMEYWANEGLERMGVGMVFFQPE